MTEHEAEQALRASLTAHARKAPPGELLAERIVDTALATRPVREYHRPRWRTWTLPLIAAGSVAAIAGALVGVSRVQHSAAPQPPAMSQLNSPRPSPRVSQPAVPPPASAQTATPPAAVQNTPGTAPAAGNTYGLTDFRIVDLSFVGPDDGWALGTADCVADPAQTCSALVHTVDGVSWAALTGDGSTPFNVPGVNGCADPCVQHLRFANDRVGYAFGPDALFMTADGAMHWTRQPGGADALETLDGNVLRVLDSGGCPPGCRYRVESAAIGSAHWTAHALPGPAGAGDGVQLVRNGHDAYLQVYGNPAGGTSARAVLWSSTDDGQHWTNRGEPCPQRGAAGEVDSVDVSAAAGAVSVLCVPRGSAGSAFIATSTDAGARFVAGPHPVPGSAGGMLAAASARTVLVLSDSTLYRSTDAGHTWHPVSLSADEPRDASWFGFESGSLARLVTDDGATVWTTRDAGASWTPHRFG